MKIDPNPRMSYQYPMPKETLPDLVVPHAIPTDERVWVPQGENVWFRPLCLNRSQGYWMTTALNRIWIQSYAVGSANLHEQSLRRLYVGERKQIICSRIGEIVAMVASDEFWPRRVGSIRSITTEIVAAVFVSTFLTSVLIGLRVSVACTTLTAGEVWWIIVSVSAVPTIFISLIIALHMRGSLEQIRKAHQELVCLAQIDGLTGLLNRSAFDTFASNAFTETQRSGRPVSALMCDIDAFRDLNDRHGHEAGDIALRSLARALEESIGSRYRILGRQGGDEFVILLPGIDLREAVMIAETLREICEARALVQQNPAAKFTISVGVETAPDAPTLGCLLRHADAALYRAKRAGGNQVASGVFRGARRSAISGTGLQPLSCEIPFRMPDGADRCPTSDRFIVLSPSPIVMTEFNVGPDIHNKTLGGELWGRDLRSKAR
jgi:diguanylate cyclase (GGDEF)-like protein